MYIATTCGTDCKRETKELVTNRSGDTNKILYSPLRRPFVTVCACCAVMSEASMQPEEYTVRSSEFEYDKRGDP
jgi:hypothetical protein